MDLKETQSLNVPNVPCHLVRQLRTLGLVERRPLKRLVVEALELYLAERRQPVAPVIVQPEQPEQLAATPEQLATPEPLQYASPGIPVAGDTMPGFRGGMSFTRTGLPIVPPAPRRGRPPRTMRDKRL